LKKFLKSAHTIIGDYMKISWLKLKDDKSNFNVFKRFGFDVFDVDKPENTDNKIKELINNNYKTIVITSELSGFSEDIIKKYNKKEDIKIIIAPHKGE